MARIDVPIKVQVGCDECYQFLLRATAEYRAEIVQLRGALQAIGTEGALQIIDGTSAAMAAYDLAQDIAKRAVASSSVQGSGSVDSEANEIGPATLERPGPGTQEGRS